MSISDLKIKLLDLSAIEQILIIEQQVHLSPWSKVKIKACFENPLLQILGCISEQELIGYAVVQVVGPEAELQNFAVGKKFQRKGVGTYLLEALIRHCENLGLRKLMLEVRESNCRAINLYQSNDFKRVGKRTNYYKTADGSEAALLFTRELN